MLVTFVSITGQGSGHGLDVLVQAALMAGSLVHVNDAFAGHVVDDGHGNFVGFGSDVLVTSRDCLDGILDVGAQF